MKFSKLNVQLYVVLCFKVSSVFSLLDRAHNNLIISRLEKNQIRGCTGDCNSSLSTNAPLQKPLPSRDESRLRILAVSPTSSPTIFPTPRPSVVPTSHPSMLPTPLPTPRPSTWPSSQPSSRPTPVPTPIPTQPTSSPTQFPSSGPTTNPSYSPTPLPTPRPSVLPTSYPSVLPTSLPTLRPSTLPSSQPTSRPTPVPTQFPTQPTSLPTSCPSSMPTPFPTQSPTTNPSSKPTMLPSSLPTPRPTVDPTPYPSSSPTFQPSPHPSTIPSAQPTSRPTSIPTGVPTQPTSIPTPGPSLIPTPLPTPLPTTSPSSRPSTVPSPQPSPRPTASPSTLPTRPTAPPTPMPTPTPYPSRCPTRDPSATPTRIPTTYPTPIPTRLPSSKPTPKPSSEPTNRPTPAVPCPPGYLTQGYNKCYACPTGTYAADGAETCTSCRSGFVTSSTASSSAADCFSPAPNFIFGTLAAILSIYLVWRYLICGRFHRVAFIRSQRLLMGCVYEWRVVYDAAKEITGNCQKEAKITSQAESEKSSESNNSFFYLKGFWFIIFAIFFIPVVVLISFAISVSSVLFSALIIWRGLHVTIRIPYEVIVAKFFGQIASVLQVILVPITWILVALSKINIDLSVVDVTCAGSQAPVQLFFNLVILGVVIVTIESGLFQYWLTTFASANKYLLFNTFTQPQFRDEVEKVTGDKWSICRYAKNILLTLGIYGFVAINPMFKCLQYLMGFVTLGAFSTSGGLHAFNPGCTKYDEALAYFSSLCAYYILYLSFYAISQVVVPGRGSWFPVFMSQPIVYAPKHATKYLQGQDTDGGGYLNETKLVYTETFFAYFSSFIALDLHLVVIGKAWAENLMTKLGSESFDSASWAALLKGAMLESVDWDKEFSSDELDLWKDKCQSDMPSLYRLCWHVFAIQNRRFFDATSSTSGQEVVEGCSVDLWLPYFLLLGFCMGVFGILTNSPIVSTSWELTQSALGMGDTDSSRRLRGGGREGREGQQRRLRGGGQLEDEAAEGCAILIYFAVAATYVAVVIGTFLAVVGTYFALVVAFGGAVIGCFFLFIAIGLFQFIVGPFFGLSHLLTDDGLLYFACTILKYCSFLLISFGVWTDHSVETFGLEEQFKRYSLENDSADEGTGLDPKASFGSLLSSIVGPRALLYLVFPQLSALCVLAYTIAPTPFIFPKSVGRYKTEELQYPLVTGYSTAKDLARKRDKVGDGSYGQEWVYDLRGISIVISESRSYLTFMNVVSFVLELGLILKPSNAWIICSLIIFLPIAFSNAIELLVAIGKLIGLKDKDFCVSRNGSQRQEVELSHVRANSGGPLAVESVEDNPLRRI